MLLQVITWTQQLSVHAAAAATCDRPQGTCVGRKWIARRLSRNTVELAFQFNCNGKCSIKIKDNISPCFPNATSCYLPTSEELSQLVISTITVASISKSCQEIAKYLVAY